jgi:hypothetical protein
VWDTHTPFTAAGGWSSLQGTSRAPNAPGPAPAIPSTPPVGTPVEQSIIAGVQHLVTDTAQPASSTSHAGALVAPPVIAGVQHPATADAQLATVLAGVQQLATITTQPAPSTTTPPCRRNPQLFKLIKKDN